MTSYILVCSCSRQDERAKESFSLLFPGTPVPEIVRGRDRIYKLAKQLSNQHVEAISKLSGKYAYYTKIDENGKIIEEYNLTTGRRTY